MLLLWKKRSDDSWKSNCGRFHICHEYACFWILFDNYQSGTQNGTLDHLKLVAELRHKTSKGK